MGELIGLKPKPCAMVKPGLYAPKSRFGLFSSCPSLCQQYRGQRERGTAVDFDEMQIDLWERLLYTNNPAYLNAFVATCSSEQLRALQMGIERVKRRNAFKLIKGGKKDEPKPSTLKGEVNL